MTVGALILAVSASAHVGAADPQPASVREAITRHRVRTPRRLVVTERVLTVESVTAKAEVVVRRESEHRYHVNLPAGCTRLVAMGDGSVQDLAVEVRGPRTMRMRQDLTRGAIEALSVCGTAAGRYEVVVSAKGTDARPGVELRVRTET
jgi:hypothetical protein